MSVLWAEKIVCVCVCTGVLKDAQHCTLARTAMPVVATSTLTMTMIVRARMMRSMVVRISPCVS